MRKHRTSTLNEIRNFEMFEIDFIVLPLQVDDNHWCSTVGDTSSLTIEIIDPYHQSKCRKNSLKAHIMDPYSSGKPLPEDKLYSREDLVRSYYNIA